VSVCFSVHMLDGDAVMSYQVIASWYKVKYWFFMGYVCCCHQPLIDTKACEC
jgi:hypothetical protein